jgi:hypothetical protein
MAIPAEWLTDAGLQNFKPVRSAIRCAAPHVLIAVDEIESLVRSVPLDANGFRRSKMMAVLEMIRDDLPCNEPIYLYRQAGQRPYALKDGVHRYYASRTLGFTHLPAEVIDMNY